jgi:hypothetical protein
MNSKPTAIPATNGRHSSSSVAEGVEFGPWVQRFVTQIRRNWFIPFAAMSKCGHVVLQFNVHKDGRLTDLNAMRCAWSRRSHVVAHTPSSAMQHGGDSPHARR